MNSLGDFFVYYIESGIGTINLLSQDSALADREVAIFSAKYRTSACPDYNTFAVIFCKQKIENNILYTETMRPIIIKEVTSITKYKNHLERYNMICNYYSHYFNSGLQYELKKYAIDIYWKHCNGIINL